MPVFMKKSGNYEQLIPSPIQTEKKLQSLIEENMPALLDMYCIASEYSTTTGGRIDSLAIDNNGCPVIVEYKRNKNDNVINQSLSYLKWLKAQKQEFFQMLVNNRLGKEVLEKITLDWKHPRVVCIAESFNRFDIDTVEVVPLKIDLYKYRYYEENLFTLDQVNISEKSESLFDTKYKGAEECLDDIESMKIGAGVGGPMSKLFDRMRDRVLELDEHILEKPGNRVVAYRMGKNFMAVRIRPDKLVVDLRSVEYEDPRGLVERIAQGYTLSLNRRVTLVDPEDLEYVCGLIEQSYKSVL